MTDPCKHEVVTIATVSSETGKLAGNILKLPLISEGQADSEVTCDACGQEIVGFVIVRE